jgi:hypothetical protein
MKTFLLSLTLLITVFVNAQSENSSIKIEQTGFSGGQAIIKLTNKQSCPSNIGVYAQQRTRFKVIGGDSFDTVRISISGSSVKVSAANLTGCGNTDHSQVQITVTTLSLPVKFVSFTATINGLAANLKWIAEEDQVSHYIIQGSKDGQQWNQVATVLAGGRGYQYTDNTASSFYRIVSVDFSGYIQYSSVIKLFIEDKGQLDVFPNPVVSTATITVKSANSVKISLYSLSGVLMKQIDTKGQKVVKIDLSGLKTGLYMVTDGISSIKFNKQ